MTDPNNFFLYFVCSGQCEVYVNSEDETKKVCFDSLNQFQTEQYVKDIETGSYFGEIAILRN